MIFQDLTPCLFPSSLSNSRVKYAEKGKGRQYKLELVFKEKGLEAKENGVSENFGINVTFQVSTRKNKKYSQVAAADWLMTLLQPQTAIKAK